MCIRDSGGLERVPPVAGVLVQGGTLQQHRGGVANRGAWLVFEDEAGFSMTPSHAKTWSPRGRTPVVQVRSRSRRRLSIARHPHGACAGGGAHRRLPSTARPGPPFVVALWSNGLADEGLRFGNCQQGADSPGDRSVRGDRGTVCSTRTAVAEYPGGDIQRVGPDAPGARIIGAAAHFPHLVPQGRGVLVGVGAGQ